MAHHRSSIIWLAVALGTVSLNGCAAAVASVPAAATNTAASQQPPAPMSSTATPTPWPLLSSTPTRCSSYTTTGGAAAPWPTVDPSNLSSLAGFDLCVLRVPRNADALGPSGGPYISRDEIERRVSGPPTGAQPTKERAFLTTLAEATRLTGGDSEGPAEYPDREVWLVVRQGGGCAIPSSKPGGPNPVAPRYCFGAIDATTGQAYFGGSGPPNSDDWPPFLPKD